MKFNSFVVFGIVLSIAAPAFLQETFNIAESINKFSLNLLAGVNLEGGDDLNIALASITIWKLLTVVSEGALDSTATQLDDALGLPRNKNIVRDSYQKLTRLLQQTKSKDTEYETSTAIFSRSEYPIKEKFETIVKQFYDATVTPVDFRGSNQDAAEMINNHVARATRNRISKMVIPADVQNAYLFITSTMYFKGQWETPFNRSATQRDAFFDDRKNKIGETQLMYKAYPFPYARIDKIKADAVELAYGFDGAFSMVVLVPRGQQTVTNMINGLTRESVTDILARLKSNHQKFPEDDIHVYFPKFKITSDFNMDRVLDNMGIRDIFDSQKANLLGMYSQYLFLSRFIQKAEIEVDEEGTVATGAGGSIFINRAPPPVVKANRPFAFLIIHKHSGSIIFAGKISNPNTL